MGMAENQSFTTSSEATIAKLRTIFPTHGLPEQLVSNSGTGFISAEFKQFIEQYGIKHIMTSPYHPSSNGLADRAVQTFKSASVSWKVLWNNQVPLKYHCN